MAFEPQFEEGENLEREINVKVSDKDRLVLVVSDRAIYFAGKKKGLTLRDAVTTERLIPGTIQRIVLSRKSVLMSVGAGLALVVLGLVWTFAPSAEGELSIGFPQAMILAGPVLALFGSRRRVLRIESPETRFAWSQPITFGGRVGKELDEIFVFLRDWASRNAVRVEGKLAVAMGDGPGAGF